MTFDRRSFLTGAVSPADVTIFAQSRLLAAAAVALAWSASCVRAWSC